MYVAKIEGEKKVVVYDARTGLRRCTIHASGPVVGVQVQGDQVAVRVNRGGREVIEIYRAQTCGYIRTIY